MFVLCDVLAAEKGPSEQLIVKTSRTTKAQLLITPRYCNRLWLGDQPGSGKLKCSKANHHMIKWSIVEHLNFFLHTPLGSAPVMSANFNFMKSALLITICMGKCHDCSLSSTPLSENFNFLGVSTVSNTLALTNVLTFATLVIMQGPAVCNPASASTFFPLRMSRLRGLLALHLCLYLNASAWVNGRKCHSEKGINRSTEFPVAQFKSLKYLLLLHAIGWCKLMFALMQCWLPSLVPRYFL